MSKKIEVKESEYPLKYYYFPVDDEWFESIEEFMMESDIDEPYEFIVYEPKEKLTVIAKTSLQTTKKPL